MPKQKAPPEKHIWARMLGREWQVILVSGEVLIRDLTGDARAIAEEIDLIADEPFLFTNSASLFRGSMGGAPVVLEYIH